MDERTRSPSGEHRNGRRHQHTNGSPRADSGSDVYVTSAAYRPPSEIRWVIPLCLYGHPIPFMETTLNKNSIVQNQREETGSVRLLLNNSPCKVSNIYPDKLSIESPRPQSYPLPWDRCKEHSNARALKTNLLNDFCHNSQCHNTPAVAPTFIHPLSPMG